jgi:DNA-directed RNA polymerase subunit beta'
MKRYRNVKLFDDESQDLDEYMQVILEKRKQEAEALAEVGVSQTENVTEDAED